MQDVLGTREKERIKEETEGQFPVLPAKTTSKLNECLFHPNLSSICFGCTGAWGFMIWRRLCLQLIVCKINHNIRVLGSLTFSFNREFTRDKQKETSWEKIQVCHPVTISPSVDSKHTHAYSQPLYFCVFLTKRQCVLTSYFTTMNFPIGSHGTNFSTVPICLFHNAKRKRWGGLLFFPPLTTWFKIQLRDGRRTAAESMAPSLSSNVSPKYKGVDV